MVQNPDSRVTESGSVSKRAAHDHVSELFVSC